MLANLVEQARTAGHWVPQYGIHIVSVDVPDHQDLQVLQAIVTEDQNQIFSGKMPETR